jgi:hypothetical protein
LQTRTYLVAGSSSLSVRGALLLLLLQLLAPALVPGALVLGGIEQPSERAEAAGKRR